jgi:hypothetical protein
LKGDHLRIISAKFGWDWLSNFRGEDFLKISSPLFSNLHNRSKWVMGFTSKKRFNLYYGIFYELWTFAYFDRLCKLEKRGDEIKKNSSPLKLLCQFQPNFAEMILGWSPLKIVSVSAVLYPRWLPWLKIEISSNGQNCSKNCRVGRSWHAEHVCSFKLPPVSYSFWNKGRKVLKFWKFDEKGEITPKWVLGFTSKLQGG